jgi:uncharacterized protein
MTQEMLPLFPLQSVLFPGGLLNLQIFEVRYLDMIRRCHKEKRPFGVVSLFQGREVRQAPHANAAKEQFHEEGTVALIEKLEQVQAGLLLIECSGGSRFRLTHQEQLKHGLWVGHAQISPMDVHMPVPPDLAHVSLALRQFWAHDVAKEKSANALPIRPPYLWDDCGWLANRWCEMLPISAALKQQMLVVESPLLRLELVADILGHFKIDTMPHKA